VPDSSPAGALVVVASAVFGLLIGSFLNVVIARVPDGRSVVRPGSRCPSCETPISPRDNLPVLGWLLLRGRARCCGTRISARYPLIEAGTGLAFAAVAVWAGRSAPTLWALPAFGYLAAISIALGVIDVDTHRLPIPIVRPAYLVSAVLLGAASWAQHDQASAIRMVAGAATLWGLYGLLFLIRPDAMGLGDVRLAGVLGMYLGWLGWGPVAVGAFMGFLVGALFGLGLVAIGRSKLKSMIPYGPHMLVGAWIAVFAGDPISNWYLHSMGL
jgi:leader peptidase (prepilin peptidase)/N-methyltransferase